LLPADWGDSICDFVLAHSAAEEPKKEHGDKLRAVR